MIAYFFLFLILLLGGSLSLIEVGRLRNSTYAIYLCFAIPILCLFAGLRAPSVDADYALYSVWFKSMIDGTLDQNPFLKDPSFALIGFGLDSVGLGIATLIAIYTAMCLSAQWSFARKAFNVRWFALGIFLILSRFYIPHEMTQIRSAVAIPLMSIAVLEFYAKKIVTGCILLLIAISFHFSAIIGLPICIAVSVGVTFDSRRWLVGFATVAIVGYFAFSRFALILALFARTSDYVTGAYETTGSNLLSVYLLCRVALVGFTSIVLWKKLGDLERLLIICSSFGVMIEVCLASNDALSIRSGELFGLFDVASALMIIRYLRRRTSIIYVVFLLCLGGVFFRSTTKIVQPYASRLGV